MPADTTTRKKRQPAESTPAPEGDHRKRRRNRTTQSCLNCHASKRMCDRKRPACQRCTALGLTGLCVYEVDDPAQRDNHLDEKALLRNRVAELEGVIREMKNKPHPRWVQRTAPSPGIADNPAPTADLWQARSRGHSFSSQASSSDMASSSSTGSFGGVQNPMLAHPVPQNAESTLLLGSTNPGPHMTAQCNTSSEPSQHSPPRIQLSIVSPTPVGTPAPGSEHAESSLLRPPSFVPSLSLTIPSPCSTPSPNMPSSPVIPSPISDFSGSEGFFPLSADGSFGSRRDSDAAFDMASLFASTSLDSTGFEDGIYGPLLNSIIQADHSKIVNGLDNTPISSELAFGYSNATTLRRAEAAQAAYGDTHCSADSHCGCAENVIAQNTITELLARLRRTAEALSSMSHHQYSYVADNQSSHCHLYGKVIELEALTADIMDKMRQRPPHPRSSTSLDSIASQGSLAERREGIYGSVEDMYSSPTTYSPPTISPQNIDTLLQWEAGRSPSRPHQARGHSSTFSSLSEDDAFMTWTQGRSPDIRQEWQAATSQ